MIPLTPPSFWTVQNEDDDSTTYVPTWYNKIPTEGEKYYDTCQCKNSQLKIWYIGRTSTSIL